jgi:hypothetical protein
VALVGKPDALIISVFIVCDMTRVGMFPTESSGTLLTSRPPIWGLHVVAMSNACWTLRGLWLRNRVRCSHDAGPRGDLLPGVTFRQGGGPLFEQSQTLAIRVFSSLKDQSQGLTPCTEQVCDIPCVCFISQVWHNGRKIIELA